MKGIGSFLFILIGNLVVAQKTVLESYPPKQDFYVGGVNGLKKDMVKIIKEQQFLPCNELETYVIPILVNEDRTINYIKDVEVVTESNKCAFEMSRKLMPYLKNWIPAQEDNKPISAIAKIEVKPFFLYYSKEDPSKNELKIPEFKGGMKSFQNKVRRIFEDRIKRNEEKITSVTFTINTKGEHENFAIVGGFSDVEKKSIIYELNLIKGAWTPATFNGVPFKSKINMPVVQNFDWDIEHEKNKMLMTPNRFH